MARAERSEEQATERTARESDRGRLNEYRPFGGPEVGGRVLSEWVRGTGRKRWWSAVTMGVDRTATTCNALLQLLWGSANWQTIRLHH